MDNFPSVRPSSRPRGPWRGLLVLGLVLLVLAACTTTDGGIVDAGPDGEQQPQTLDVGAGTGPLPEASFTDLREPDRRVTTTDWQGTPTVVNFWATWCASCIDEMPALQSASEQLDGRVRFVGIDLQDPREEALAFLDETGVTYEQVASPGLEYLQEVGARGMPTTLFVDADGVVQYRYMGPLTEDEALDLVAEHLGVQS